MKDLLLRAVGAAAAVLQFDRLSGNGVTTYRYYAVPPLTPIQPGWSDCANVPGFHASGQAVCDARRVWINSGPLTYDPYPNTPQDGFGALGICKDGPYNWLGYPGRWLTCPIGYSQLTPITTIGGLCGDAVMGWGPDAMCRSFATAIITVVSGCPVPELTPVETIPPNGPDVLPLTLRLEQSRGADLALTPETETARQCLIGKASVANVTVVTTSGTRTIAYQKHLIEIWDKMKEHNKYKDIPAIWEACKTRREKVIAEKGCSSNTGCVGACTAGSHCIRYPPAINSKHPDGRAFDVSGDTINDLRTNLAARQPPQSISELLTSPPACNLTWGGGFNDPDDIHFQQ